MWSNKDKGQILIIYAVYTACNWDDVNICWVFQDHHTHEHWLNNKNTNTTKGLIDNKDLKTIE